MISRGLAAALLAAVLLPAVASGAKTRTIVVTSVTVSMVRHDAGPKGASAGDTVSYRDRLLNAARQFGRKKGAAVGRDQGRLTFTGASTATYQGTATFPGGTLRLSGVVYSAPGGGLVVPVVGGTGAYAGARGTLTVGSGRDHVLNTYRFSLGAPIA